MAIDRRIIKTKESIKNAYMTLLLEKKTAKITIAELARTANIDRKTFYLHYTSTDDVIKDISEESMKTFLVILEENGFFERPYDTHIYFQCMNQLLERDMDVFQKIVKHPDFNYFWEQVETVMVKTLAEYLEGIVDMSKEEIAIYTTFLASGINSVYIKWIKNEMPITLEELGLHVSNITYWGAQKFLPSR